MKNLGVICLFLTVITLLASCSKGGEDKGAKAVMPPQEFPVIEVDTMSIQSYKSYPVTIEGTKSIAIRAKVDGYISEVCVDEGEWVKKGAPLFRLETRSLTQQAKAAKASVEVAQVEVDRLKPLVEKAIVSQVQLKRAEAALELQKSNYETVRANIAYTNITSPVEGVVGSITMREGALISPSTVTPLTNISSIKELYGYFSINEKAYLSLIKSTPGVTLKDKINNLPNATLILADGSEYQYRGVIETIAGDIDKSTGAIRLRATFDNRELLLKDGSSGVVRLPNSYRGAIVIPKESIYDIQGVSHIYIVKDNRVESRAITIGETIGKYLIVEDGLERGVSILAKGSSKVASGVEITAKEVPMSQIIESFDQVFK